MGTCCDAVVNQEAELTILYNFYVDCMPSEDMAEVRGKADKPQDVVHSRPMRVNNHRVAEPSVPLLGMAFILWAELVWWAIAKSARRNTNIERDLRRFVVAEVKLDSTTARIIWSARCAY